MNIFVLNENPVKAAKDNCDIHCNKMLLECCQMLANCFKEDDLKSAPLTKAGKIRKYSYYNHPVSKFTRENRSNMRWVIDHAFELENQRLISGFNPHFSVCFLKWVSDNFNYSKIPNGALTKFAVAISENKNCRKIENFEKLSEVEKYRLYYKKDKPFAKWTNRPVPDWFLK